jgi:hypothetical protein
MTLVDILNDPPRPHKNPDGGFMVMGLTEPPLQFIYDNVDDSSVTLETGCGLSTAVFAVKGSRHTVIAPAPEEFAITKAYCRDRGIPTDQINFITEASQKVLPVLESEPLDLVLIDGGHGFPTPYIDWFYTAGLMKNGGFLMVDDVWLWSCQILRDFLMEQPQWEFVAEYEGRTAVFKKISDGAEWLEWTQQPLVARGGKLKWIEGKAVYEGPTIEPVESSTAIKRALSDLKRGDFQLVVKKLGRRLR